jgi:Tol biopolymer transport system component
MTARAVQRTTVLGLSIVLVFCRSPQAQEPKPDQPAGGQPGKENGRKETPARAVGRLIEGLRRHPVERSAVQGLGRIYALDVETGEVILVADESVRGLPACGSPTWSHDGKRILFDAFPRGQVIFAELKLIELAGEGLALASLGAGNSPSFSPDEQRIVFRLGPDAVPDAPEGIWLMQADGSKRRRLGDGIRPQWSPDGRQLMLIDTSTPRKVALMDVDSKKTVNLQLSGSSICATPSWAGASTIVALTGPDGTGDTLALIDVSEPREAKVKHVLWKKHEPIFEMIDPVYSTSRRECVFIGVTNDGMALYSVRQGKSDPPKRLESDDYDSQIWDLAFSPDGRYVLFGSTRPDRRRR